MGESEKVVASKSSPRLKRWAADNAIEKGRQRNMAGSIRRRIIRNRERITDKAKGRFLSRETALAPIF
jgi:hypothetical protein